MTEAQPHRQFNAGGTPAQQAQPGCRLTAGALQYMEVAYQCSPFFCTLRTCAFQEASRSAMADAEADLSLLRQLLQSAAAQNASHNFNAAEVSNACHICSKVRVYIAPSAKQLCNRLNLHAHVRYLVFWKVQANGRMMASQRRRYSPGTAFTVSSDGTELSTSFIKCAGWLSTCSWCHAITAS